MLHFLFCLFCLFCFCHSAFSYALHNLSIATGFAYNLPSNILISQQGYKDISFVGKFDTKPLTPPPYYQIRYTYWQKEYLGWGLEFVHHKLYLQNKPSQVQKFTITNGYNLISVNTARKFHKKYFSIIYRLGLGVVLTHPETMINNLAFDESGGLPWFDGKGYYIGGPLGVGSVVLSYDFIQSFSIFAEMKLAISYVKVPIAQGHARLVNLSGHGLIGIVYDF